MRYHLLVSHGEFSAGLHTALSMLVGPREDVLHVGLKDGTGTPEFKEKVNAVTAAVTAEDELLVLADLVGGSPLTTTMEALSERLDLNKVRAVGGMNLPMAIAAVECEDEPLEDAVAAMMEGAAEQIKPFRLAVDDDEEEEL